MTCITESQFSYSVHGNIGLDNKQTTLFVCKESYSIGDKQPIVSVECNYTEYKTRYSIGRIHKISLFVWRWLLLCRKEAETYRIYSQGEYRNIWYSIGTASMWVVCFSLLFIKNVSHYRIKWSCWRNAGMAECRTHRY